MENNNNETPEWAKAIIESNQALQAKIESIESGKANESRQKQLESKLEGVKDSIKEAALKNFKYAKFDNEEEFQEYLNDVVPSVESAETANQDIEDQGITDSVRRFVEQRKQGYEGDLPGRNVSEDPHTRKNTVSGSSSWEGKEI